MKYTDFLIEVKTPWKESNEKYERKVIRYNCKPGTVIDKPIFACRYLNEIEIQNEYSKNKESEGLIVHAIDINTEEEITNPSEFISVLIEFVSYQWNY